MVSVIRVDIIKIAALFVLCALLSLSSYAVSAQDDCLPGLPCLTSATINNPWDNEIASNQPDAPNYLKSSRDTCDADFMNQIYARAYLEAEREHTMLQTIIKKPDSVLEYSCFKGILNQYAYHLPGLFSETKDFSASENGSHATIDLDGDPNDDYDPEADADYGSDTDFGDLEIDVYMGDGYTDAYGNDISLSGGETRLGKILEALVLRSLYREGSGSSAYINANFSNSFLGGSLPVLNHSFSEDISPQPFYLCAKMNLAWFAAKCSNFTGPDTVFYGFEDMAIFDPRQFPVACEANEDENTRMITAENIALAQNIAGANAFYDSARFVNDIKTLGYSDFTGDTCLPPIPTGVTVIIYKPSNSMIDFSPIKEEHPDHVCVNPGCFYDVDSNKCKKEP